MVPGSDPRDVLECMDISEAKETFSQLRISSNSTFLSIHKFEVIKVLMRIHSDFSSCTSNGRNYLHFAVEHGRTDWVDELIREGYDVNERDDSGMTPLLCLTQKQAVDVTHLLVQSGADISSVDNQGKNVAHKMVEQWDTVPAETMTEWVTYVLENYHNQIWHQQDINGVSPYSRLINIAGRTNSITKALMLHMTSSSERIFRSKQHLLIDVLCDGNDSEFCDYLEFFFGAAGGSIYQSTGSGTPEFMEFGDAKGTLGRLDLSQAKQAFSELRIFGEDAFRNMYELKTLQILLGFFPDFRSCNWNKWNYLHYAVKHGNVVWVKHLTNSQWDINQKDKDGNTPLLCLSAENPVETTRLLLSKNCAKNAVNNLKQNVAHRFLKKCSSNDTDTVVKWVIYTLNGNLKNVWTMTDNKGETPVKALTKLLGLHHSATKTVFNILCNIHTSNKCALVEASLREEISSRVLDLIQVLFDTTGNKSSKLAHWFAESSGVTKDDHLLCEAKAKRILRRIDILEARCVLIELDMDCLFKHNHTLELLKVFLHILPDSCLLQAKSSSYLHYAVRHGQVEWASYLINEGLNVNERDENGSTPLHWLTIKNSLSVSQMLINNGADVYAVNRYNDNVAHKLFSQCSSENLDLITDWVSYMIDQRYHHVWNVENSNSATPFRQLVMLAGSKHQVTKSLLSHRLISLSNKRVLMEEALKQYNDAEIIDLLLRIACSHEYNQITTEHNRPREAFQTTDIIEQLDVSKAAEMFQGMIDYDVLQGVDVFSQIRDLETLKVIMHIRPDFSPCNTDRYDYLHYASSQGRIDWMQYLLDIGHDVNQCSGCYNTPLLMISPDKRPAEVTRLLIENGANVYAVNRWKQNIAHMLLMTCTGADVVAVCDWIRLILQKGHGRLWNMENQYGDTPMQQILKMSRSTDTLLSLLDAIATFAKNRCETLTYLSRQNKRILIEAAMSRYDDQQMLELILLLFGREVSSFTLTAETHPQHSLETTGIGIQRILSVGVNWFTKEEIVKHLDLCEAHETVSLIRLSPPWLLNNVVDETTKWVWNKICPGRSE